MAELLAVYGAVVATASALWQAYTWGQNHVLRVKVDLEQATSTRGTVSDHLVVIRLTNGSAFPVKWIQAGLDLQDGSGQFALVGLADHVADDPQLPLTVPSRDSAMTAIEAQKVIAWGFDPTKPLTAQVTLSTRQQFKSKPTTLASGISSPEDPAM